MSKFFSIVAMTLFLGLPALSQNPSGAEPNTLATAPVAQSAQVPSEAAVSPTVRMIANFRDWTSSSMSMRWWIFCATGGTKAGCWRLIPTQDRTAAIGAGFSLDLPEREHTQTDPLNPHQFLEPSSAGPVVAAGFDPRRLDDILKVFYERKRQWSKRTWRRQIYRCLRKSPIRTQYRWYELARFRRSTTRKRIAGILIG